MRPLLPLLLILLRIVLDLGEALLYQMDNITLLQQPRKTLFRRGVFHEHLRARATLENGLHEERV